MVRRAGGGYDPLNGDTGALFPAAGGGPLAPATNPGQMPGPVPGPGMGPGMGPDPGMKQGPFATIPGQIGMGGGMGGGMAPAPDLGRQMMMEELARKIGQQNPAMGSGMGVPMAGVRRA